MCQPVLISACLLGDNCRYDGGNSGQHQLINTTVNWIPVCPEVIGGLPTPRPRSELIRPAAQVIKDKKYFVDIDQLDMGDAIVEGAMRCMELIKEKNISTAILKSKSPSCGIGKIYDGKFSGTLIEGNGVLAQLCIDSGLKVISSSDEFSINELIGEL